MITNIIRIINMLEVFIWMLVIAMGLGLPQQSPVIGVYTEDAEDFMNFYQNDKLLTDLDASYVKYLQMSGAQVVPIFYHYTQTQIRDLLGKLNGVLFPGGWMSVNVANQWTHKFKIIVDHVSEMNNQGITYPIWGTCQGFEVMMYLTSGSEDNRTVFSPVQGQLGRVAPLKIITPGQIFNDISQQQMSGIVSDGIFFYNHHWAITLQNFRSNHKWNEYWELIATSKTLDGVEFVAAVQSKQYPYFITQFHPQKNSFQWRVPAKHSYSSVRASQKIMNSFMEAARRNPNTLPEEQLMSKVIHNYHPVVTPLDCGFQQIYIFNEADL